jgi:hypothetical protein
MRRPKGARSTDASSCDVNDLSSNLEITMRLRLLALCAITCTLANAQARSADSLHLCIAPPSAQMLGMTGDAAAATVREAFKGYLAGPGLDVELLDARLPSLAREEARQKRCRFVLYATAVQERSQGSGLLGRIAVGALHSGASQVAADTHSAGTRVLANAAAGGAASTYYGSFTHASDRLTLTTRIEFPDGNVLSRESEKRKAKSDQEDLLSPLVERLAGRAVTAMSGAKP